MSAATKKSRKIKIDEEISALLPVQTSDEAALLEQCLVAEGCRDALVVWKETGILMDGHGRLPICRKRKIPFKIKLISFRDRETAKQWVIDTQMARRNLTDERRAYYRGLDYLNRKQHQVGETVLPDGHSDHPGKTLGKHPETAAEEVAAKYDVGEKTIRRDAEFAAAVDKIGEADPEKKEAILNGEVKDSKKAIIASVPLCDRCRRVGPVKDCEACKEAAKAAKKKSDKVDDSTRQPGDDTPDVKDAVGHEVPEDCGPAFATAEKFKEMDSLCAKLQSLMDELAKLPGGEQLARLLKATASGERIIHKHEALNTLKRDLKGVRPHSVCPWCKGKGTKGCKGCSGAGWVTKTTWDGADEKTKERLAC